MVLQLTKEILATYRKYKRDQQLFLDYLVANAKANDVNHQQLQTGKLPLWKVLSLANTIAHDPEIERISIEAADALQSVVKRRARCACWYKSKLNIDDVEAQLLFETHRYPLQIFTQALEVLWGKLPPIEKFSMHSVNIKTSRPADIITDLQELDLGSHDIMVEEPKSKSVYNYAKISAADEDAMRLSDMLILLSDVLDAAAATEAFLWEVWAGYLAGSVSFSIAVALTNVSVVLVRTLEQDAIDGNESLDSYETATTKSKALKQLHEHGTKLRLGLPADPVLRMENLLADIKAQDLRGESLNRQNAAGQMPGASVPNDREASHEWLYLRALWSFKKEELRQNTPTGDPSDEVHRALRWLEQQTQVPVPGDIPIYIAFAIRVDMVAKFVVVNGEHRLQAHKEVYSIYRRLEDELNEVKKFGKAKAKLFRNSLFNEVEASNYQQAAKDVSNLLLNKMGSDIASSWGKAQENEKMHLIFSKATWLFDFRLKTANLAAVITIDTGLLQILANIYCLCKTHGTVISDWHDIAYLESKMSTDFVFKGPKITESSSIEYFNQMRFKCDLRYVERPNSAFTLMRSLRRWKASRTVVESMQHLWPLCTLLAESITKEDPGEGATSDRLQTLLRATSVQQLTGKKPRAIKCMRDDAQKLVFKNQTELAKYTSKSPPLGIVQMLSLLKDDLVKELDLADLDFPTLQKRLILLALRLGLKWQEKQYDAVRLQPGQLYSAVEYARDVALNLTQAISSASLHEGTAESRARVQEMLKEAGGVIESFITEYDGVGWSRVGETKSSHKSMTALPREVLAQLKINYEKYGMTDCFFDESQREGVFWLEEVTSVRGTIAKMYAKSGTG